MAKAFSDFISRSLSSLCLHSMTTPSAYNKGSKAEVADNRAISIATLAYLLMLSTRGNNSSVTAQERRQRQCVKVNQKARRALLVNGDNPVRSCVVTV